MITLPMINQSQIKFEVLDIHTITSNWISKNLIHSVIISYLK